MTAALPKYAVEVILLAAGLSSRMGAINKLLIEVKGVPLIRRMAMLYLGVSDAVTIVLGHEAEQVAQTLDKLPVRLRVNPGYADGLAGSMRLGLQNISAMGRAVLVGVSDQPKLVHTDLIGLLDDFAQTGAEKITIPFYGAARGNPIVIPAAVARHMQADNTNPACRRFTRDHPELTRIFAAQNDHFTADMDTPEDARHLGIRLPPEKQDQGGTPRYENNR